uniref:Uncharacterized protein n=1 Tax=Oryza glumipatula TaxID=40148 RepID=A0A0E0A174_9ORYZ
MHYQHIMSMVCLGYCQSNKSTCYLTIHLVYRGYFQHAGYLLICHSNIATSGGILNFLVSVLIFRDVLAFFSYGSIVSECKLCRCASCPAGSARRRQFLLPLRPRILRIFS